MVTETPDNASSKQESAGTRGRGLRVLAFTAVAVAALSVALSGLALLFAVGVLPPLRKTDDLERQLHAYILANPEVILESVKGLEARQQAAANSEAAKVVSERQDEIFNDPDAPVGMNPQGDAILVEFFDYNCPYCRQAAPLLGKLENADKGLRLVFKEYPILGPGSVFAARAALASRKQGKYLAYHQAMMSYEGRITETSRLDVAANVGIDVERLKKDMQDPAINAAIKRNIALAEALRIGGTPSFVVGKEVVRGLVDEATMKRLIASARGS
ncbi:protein-disulfide isomerase [Sinorhizobium kostiense]|uniref:Protein-disulfide isomerase n=1 Tax=Sinorhizobium kostiense TaxID=76747 RepID=A0ABS4RAF5_9HYPH|nr:DsbA family protein [Sinorhizobium kostiense]MBP2238817.1 protein-disulfide isomerase [Sinorhizobium kostiense]